MRARVIYVSSERVDAETMTYEELADPKWKGRVCIRSGQHPYNTSLFAAMIAKDGPEATEDFLTGLKANLARTAGGGDRDVARDILADICDVGIANSYYVGLMRSGAGGPEQEEWGEAIRVILPTFADGAGTHVNISGAAVAEHAPNRDNAVKLLEFLVSPEAQAIYAKANFEYPVLAGAEVDPIIAELGELKIDPLPLTEIAAHRKSRRASWSTRSASIRRCEPRRSIELRWRSPPTVPGPGGIRPRPVRMSGGSPPRRSSSRSCSRRSAASSISRRAAPATSGRTSSPTCCRTPCGRRCCCSSASARSSRSSASARRGSSPCTAFPGRRVFEWALLLPLAVPTYIVAYAYLDVMHPIGPVQTTLREILGIARPRDLWFPEIRSLHGCIFLLGMVLYPYVYLPVRALFLMQSAATIEVARTLGAGPLGVFLRVALPLARPAIAVGVSLALMEALNDIGASEFLGIRTLTVAIYTTWTTRMSVEGAAQIALIMLCVVLALILLERWARRRQRFATKARIDHTPSHAQLVGPARRGGEPRLLAADPLRLPRAGELPRHRIMAALPLRRPAERLAGWIGNTLLLRGDRHCRRRRSSGSCWPIRRACRGAPPRRSSCALASIGYAVPGTVLAVGLLVPLASLDNAVDAVMRATFGVSTGLLLTGSGAALVLAYVIRFLAISAGGIEAGLAKVSPHLDMAARSLGSRPAKVLRTHPPAAARSGDRRGGDPRLRRLHEGAAGDAAAAALQLHDARHRALRRGEARHLRGRRHRRARHRAGRA